MKNTNLKYIEVEKSEIKLNAYRDRINDCLKVYQNYISSKGKEVVISDSFINNNTFLAKIGDYEYIVINNGEAMLSLLGCRMYINCSDELKQFNAWNKAAQSGDIKTMLEAANILGVDTSSMIIHKDDINSLVEKTLSNKGWKGVRSLLFNISNSYNDYYYIDRLYKHLIDIDEEEIQEFNERITIKLLARLNEKFVKNSWDLYR